LSASASEARDALGDLHDLLLVHEDAERFLDFLDLRSG
jgi:hypothetical protein